MASPTLIVGYLALFFGAGIAFLFVNLLVGHFLRPSAPNREKLEVYECGEPTIGSSFVQFDLRFYVVALLFIIFDVEVAFFFPWAVVFGKATHLMDPQLAAVTTAAEPAESAGAANPVAKSPAAASPLTPVETAVFRELGVPSPATQVLEPSPEPRSRDENRQAVRDLAHRVALMSLVDIAAFFAVLLVGFAYVWKRGDLDWVRALSRERAAMPPVPPVLLVEEEPAISA